MKIKRLLFSLSLTLFLLVVSAGVVECIIPEVWILPSFDTGGYKVTLDHRLLYRIKSSQINDINSQGYRDIEFPRSKSGKKRILFLGDSVTMGANVNPGETTPAVLGRLLGPSYEVLNMGIFGYGPDQSFFQLLDEGLAMDPDGVILGINPSNDFNDLVKNKLLGPGKNDELVWSSNNVVTSNISRSRLLAAFDFIRFKLGKDKGKYRAIFTALFGDGYDWKLLTEPQSISSQNKKTLMYFLLKNFQEELSAREIPFLVVIYPTYEAYQGMKVFSTFNLPLEKRFSMENLTRAICRQANAACLDLYPFFELEEARSYQIFEDENGHPGLEGYQRIAGYIYENFKSEELQEAGWKFH